MKTLRMQVFTLITVVLLQTKAFFNTLMRSHDWLTLFNIRGRTRYTIPAWYSRGIYYPCWYSLWGRNLNRINILWLILSYFRHLQYYSYFYKHKSLVEFEYLTLTFKPRPRLKSYLKSLNLSCMLPFRRTTIIPYTLKSWVCLSAFSNVDLPIKESGKRGCN